MLKKFLENCKKPQGKLGKFIINAMNKGHAPLSRWALTVFPPADGERFLDVGCGGGGNLVKILKQNPLSYGEGIDYSPVSVECSRRVTQNFTGRCKILQGDVMQLPYEKNTFDRVVSFESIYFWPNPITGVSEIWRVLKPGGKFMLALEMVEPNTGKFWSTRCQGMKIYTEQELTLFLEKSGFENIRSYRTHRSWCAMEGIKRA